MRVCNNFIPMGDHHCELCTIVSISSTNKDLLYSINFIRKSNQSHLIMFDLHFWTLYILLFSVQPESFEVLVGTHQWRTSSFGGKRHKVNVTIVHEWYGFPEKHSNDIALVRVNEPFEFNEKVQPITISRENVPEHTRLQFTGWGLLSTNEVKQNFTFNSTSIINFSIYKSWKAYWDF